MEKYNFSRVLLVPFTLAIAVRGCRWEPCSLMLGLETAQRHKASGRKSLRKKNMARCFLLEVNNRGVENHLLCTINPPRFLHAGLLEGPAICDGLRGKRAKRWHRRGREEQQRRLQETARLVFCKNSCLREALLSDARYRWNLWRRGDASRTREHPQRLRRKLEISRNRPGLKEEGQTLVPFTKTQCAELIRRSTLTPAGEPCSLFY